MATPKLFKGITAKHVTSWCRVYQLNVLIHLIECRNVSCNGNFEVTEQYVPLWRKAEKLQVVKAIASSDSNIFSTNAGWMNPQMLKAVFDIEAE